MNFRVILPIVFPSKPIRSYLFLSTDSEKNVRSICLIRYSVGGTFLLPHRSGWHRFLQNHRMSFAVFNVSGYGNMGVGWTLDGVNFLGGTLRMLFPFSLGMLMSRNFKPMKVNGAFWICTIILIALFSVPYLEGLEPICMNASGRARETMTDME